MTDTPNPSPDRREAYARVIDALGELLRCADDADGVLKFGLMDCRDNTGATYQSADLERTLKLASSAYHDALIAMQAPAVGGEAEWLKRLARYEEWLRDPTCDPREAMSIVYGHFPHPQQTFRADLAQITLPYTAVGGGQPVAWLRAHCSGKTPSVTPMRHIADKWAQEGAVVRPLYAHPTPVREPEGTRDLLAELLAVVKGECPSLLNEDSGGNADLALRIEEALAQPTPPSLGQEDQGSDSGSPTSRRGSLITDRSGDA